MRVLFIIEDINSATGFCVQKIAKVMNSKGHIVDILSRYESNEKLDGISYYTTNTINKTPVKFQILLNVYRWPIKNMKLVKEFIKVGNSIVCKNNTEIVISVYNSIEAILAGISIKKSNKSVKFVSYFLDALYKGQYLKFMPYKFSDYRALKMQSYILRYSDTMVIMRSVKKQVLYSKLIKHKDRIAFLDIPLLDYNNKKCRNHIHNASNKLTCVYIGSLPRHIRNPKYLLELFSRLDNAELYLYGINGYPEYVQQYEGYDNIHFNGLVSKEESNIILENCDVAVNISNSISTMLPSKIFEYMSNDKFILSVYKGDNDPCHMHLNEYGKYMCISESETYENAIKRFNIWINSFKGRNNKINNDISSNDFLYKNTPEAFVELMENIYEKK